MFIEMLKSKRFVAFIVAIVLFLLLAFLTDYNLMEIAGSIAIIAAIYTAGESFRASTPKGPPK